MSADPPRSDPRAWEPLARALEDYLFGGVIDAEIEVESDDGLLECVPVEVFAGQAEPPGDAELHALGVCRGHVLDAGAGAGRHSLELQHAGAHVTALDASSAIVDIMRRRGVRDARVGDVFALAGDRFDTVLMLMNGVGITGTISGLDLFLERAHGLVAENGQLLFDSCDLRSVSDARTKEAIRAREARGRYGGEVTFRMRYRGREGASYPWLFLDFETLARRAALAHWHAQILFEDQDTTYLARLTDVAPARI